MFRKGREVEVIEHCMPIQSICKERFHNYCITAMRRRAEVTSFVILFFCMLLTLSSSYAPKPLRSFGRLQRAGILKEHLFASTLSIPTTMNRSSSSSKRRNVFLTGQPGCGKSTMIMRCIERLASEGVIDSSKMRGFYTEEVRKGAERAGFDVVLVNPTQGKVIRSPLARLGKTKPLVGKYSVDLESFEAVGIPALDVTDAESSSLLVLDEVGKMELHSPAFYPAVTKALESDVVIFGTVPMPRYGHTIREVEAIKERSDVHLFHLTKSTRDELFEVVYQTLKGILSGNIGTDDILPSNDDMTNSIAAAGLVPNGQSSRRQKPSDSDSKKPMASADDMSSDPIPAPPLVGNVPPKVLLMGNTASPATRSNSFDYAERSWWSMLDYALGINEAASYDSKKEALNHAGIVLWDICPDVHVKGTKSGSNKNSKKRSRSTSYNDIEGFISLHPTVKRVCLNGVGAEKIFSGAFPEFRSKYPSVDVVTLPSSSRANSSMSMEKKRQSWKEALGSR